MRQIEIPVLDIADGKLLTRDPMVGECRRIRQFWFDRNLLKHPDSWKKRAFSPTILEKICRDDLLLNLRMLNEILEKHIMPGVQDQFSAKASLWKEFMKG